MYYGKTDDSEYIASGLTLLSVLHIHSCTAIPNFAQKNLSIITFRMKKQIHYSWYNYTEEFKIVHAR